MDVMKAFEKAVKADDAAGKMLIDMVVYSAMADLADDCRADIAKAYGPWALDRIQVAKRQLGRTYVAKAVEGEYPDLQQTAEWLVGLERFVAAACAPEEVSKMEWHNFGGVRRQVNVRRDSHGRFARGLNTESKVAIQERSRDRLSPTVRRYTDENSNVLTDQLPTGVVEEDLQRAQSQWEQATSITREFKQAVKDPKNADVQMLVRNKDTKELKILGFNLGDFKGRLPEDSDLNPGSMDEILTIEMVPTADADPVSANQIAAFNTLSSMGASTLASMATVDPNRLTALRNELQMTPEPRGFLDRLFGLFSAGGSVLEQTTGYESLGAAARFVGALGPEASSVLGPYVQQAAYRYRGTETSPDKMLMREFESNGMKSIDAYADEPQVLAARLENMQMAGKRGPAQAAMSGPASALQNSLDMGLSGDSLRMQVRADIASRDLMKYLPSDPIVAALSEKSGQVLPSHGILIGDNGEIVSQSVGFTDDHYLPFNLGNLAELRGGQYVRTRVMGGLTGEDVYTAVTAGARQVQVVSGSGVFTLEFAPDFRGARGNSDKARSMYDRYLKILDAVENSGLYLQDITPQEQNKLWNDARRKLGPEASEEEIRAEFNTRREAKRLEMTSVTDTDIATAEMNALQRMGLNVAPTGNAQTDQAAVADAMTRLSAKDRRVYTDLYENEIDQIRSEKANKLRLNGEGYAVALQTLREQFPYFIRRVEYRKLNEIDQSQSANRAPKTRQFATDRGYAAPGGLRADSVRSGFFRTGNINPPAKQRAQQEETAAAPRGGGDTPPSGGGKTAPKEAEKPAAAQAFTDSGVGAIASQMGERLGQDAAKRLESMILDISGIGSGDVLGDSDFADIQDSNGKIVRWLFAGQNKSTLDAVLADPEQRMRVAEALTDSDLVAGELRKVAAMNAGGNDFFADGGMILGKKNLDDAAFAASDIAEEVAEDLMLISPKMKPSGDTAKDAFHDGPVPLAFPDVETIDSEQTLEQFKADQPDLYDRALEMTVDVDPRTGEEEFRTVGDIADAVKGDIENLKKIHEGFLAVQAGKRPEVAVDRAAWRAAFPDKELTVDNVYEAGRLAEAEAMDLQKVWSTAVTIRALEKFEMLDRGGEVMRPKVEDRWLKPVRKALELPKPTLPVVPEDDPLAVEVRKMFEEGRLPSRSRQLEFSLF